MSAFLAIMERTKKLSFDRILVALGSAILAGCFGGTLLMILLDPNLRTDALRSPGASFKTYIFISLASAYIVVPTTLLFGLPSTLLIRGADLSARGSAILIAISAGLGATFGNSMAFWNVPAIGEGAFINWAFPALYALPAAFALWWVLKPSSNGSEGSSE